MFFFKFWIQRPQSSCASKNRVVVFIQHFGLRAREYQSSDPFLSSTAPIFTGANIGSISRCTFQIFHGNVKIVQIERKLRSVRTATTSGQYPPVRPSRSVSKRLILWLKSCKVLIYVLFFMSSTKKSPFLTVSTWLLVPGKIQDRRQDGDLCWWRHRPPAAPPSIKYTFSC